jgi:hypothetical protein
MSSQLLPKYPLEVQPLTQCLNTSNLIKCLQEECHRLIPILSSNLTQVAIHNHIPDNLNIHHKVTLKLSLIQVKCLRVIPKLLILEPHKVIPKPNLIRECLILKLVSTHLKVVSRLPLDILLSPTLDSSRLLKAMLIPQVTNTLLVEDYLYSVYIYPTSINSIINSFKFKLIKSDILLISQNMQSNFASKSMRSFQIECSPTDNSRKDDVELRILLADAV